MLAHAKKTNQVVVTSNHDMILLCAEQEEPVIWIDPRSRQFRRTELVPLVFTRVEDRQKLLADADGPICVRVLRTKTDVLEVDAARYLVEQRMRRLQARKRARSKKDTGTPTLADM